MGSARVADLGRARDKLAAENRLVVVAGQSEEEVDQLGKYEHLGILLLSVFPARRHLRIVAPSRRVQLINVS